jgi:hypothetical protein
MKSTNLDLNSDDGSSGNNLRAVQVADDTLDSVGDNFSSDLTADVLMTYAEFPNMLREDAVMVATQYPTMIGQDSYFEMATSDVPQSFPSQMPQALPTMMRDWGD